MRREFRALWSPPARRVNPKRNLSQLLQSRRIVDRENNLGTPVGRPDQRRTRKHRFPRNRSIRAACRDNDYRRDPKHSDARTKTAAASLLRRSRPLGVNWSTNGARNNERKLVVSGKRGDVRVLVSFSSRAGLIRGASPTIGNSDCSLARETSGIDDPLANKSELDLDEAVEQFPAIARITRRWRSLI